MYQRLWHYVFDYLVMVLFIFLVYPSFSFAHGQADLCDRRENLIEQCGEFHNCIVDELVSPNIGYCKAEFEDLDFTMCNRHSEEVPCPVGEVCKIGTIDPNIGVCSPLSTTHPMMVDEELTMSESGCQSQPYSQSPLQLFFGLCLMSLYVYLRHITTTLINHLSQQLTDQV